jgi:retron-type reverse transcriptase
MGGRKNKSTKIALELLIEKIRIIWTSKKHVATLLSIDILGAFDIVNHIRLLEILRKKGLPPWIVQWIRAFLKNRSTTLVIQKQETALSKIDTRVLQGSLLSPILFLFYNATLIEIGNQPQRSLLLIRFAGDINLLIYRPFTQANCRKHERIHKDLLK